MSGTGTSSRIGALPYSCMRAAFISALLFIVGLRFTGRLRLVTKCSDSRLCNRNVLFNGAGTCPDCTDDGPVQNDGYSAAEDDDLSRVAFLNTEKWLSRLREPRQIRGSFVEHSRCYRLIDGEVDAADERAGAEIGYRLHVRPPRQRGAKGQERP